MKKKPVVLITVVALVSIFLLQGMWLYSTYNLLETEFEGKISDLLIVAIEKEAMLRVNDPAKKGQWKQQEIWGVHPNNDHYTNNIALQDYLYHEDYPLSLAALDSVFKEEIKDKYKNLDYSFLITDSIAYQTVSIHTGPKNLNRLLSYQETVRIRNIAPGYITIFIASPYKIIVGQMLMQLIGTLVLAVAGVYGLIFQINMIRRQVKVAEMRQDFTNAMVHDMITPVMTVLIGVSALQDEKIDANPKKKGKHHKAIGQAGEHIRSIANKVIEIVRFEEQRVTLSKQQINLADLLNRLMERYQSATLKKVHYSTD